jgi:transposase
VWRILEGEFELIMANPAHIRNVPGRKSDVKDATWIADLLAHGLIRSSMVPPGPIQELRDLTRTRKQLMREVVQHKQRIQKVLENANEVGFGSVGRVWPETTDAPGDHRRANRCPQTGSLEQRTTVRVARNPGPGAARQDYRPSSVLA